MSINKQVRVINMLANLLTFVALVLAVLSLTYWVVHLPYFDLERIYVQERQGGHLKNVSPNLLNNALIAKISGNFFTVNLDSVAQQVKQVPWVRSVQVRRLWPNGLVLYVEEHEPFAYWNSTQMIDTWGDVFTPSNFQESADMNLLHFQGPENSAKLVVKRYQYLAKMLSKIHLSVESITLNDRYAWNIRLDNGITLLLSRDEVAESLEDNDTDKVFNERISRFVNAWKEIQAFNKEHSIAIIDLRYSKGFAVKLAPKFKE
ncbi:cell division protein FtsQ/DivIB [Basilea psittacipulmonis]|uniref:Cell division protein FtsQ n=1 Tax=Basilea psittacipulmonis DSM 24701 TaxID=1072685 RepID=A0A077DGP1_9BURK|nr:cell division protein FtsQ/DivIB [Basilea psittacipulmonis]AIL32323.1 hypothetical protein IX83_02420 [Basilea psittacipulmonis DSM 24701]